MIIQNENPPNILDIQKVFTVSPTTVFTYGAVIFNPNKCPIDIPIMAHEELHSRQQGDNPAGWWTKYLEDPVFRLEQETDAYAIQYYVQCQFIKNRNTRALNLNRLADTLSGEMYGNMITYKQAKEAILWKTKNKNKK